MRWRRLRQAAGIGLIVLGFLAIITPFTPGGWLVFIGAELLGIEMFSPKRVKEHIERFQAWLRTTRDK